MDMVEICLLLQIWIQIRIKKYLMCCAALAEWILSLFKTGLTEHSFIKNKIRVLCWYVYVYYEYDCNDLIFSEYWLTTVCFIPLTDPTDCTTSPINFLEQNVMILLRAKCFSRLSTDLLYWCHVIGCKYIHYCTQQWFVIQKQSRITLQQTHLIKILFIYSHHGQTKLELGGLVYHLHRFSPHRWWVHRRYGQRGLGWSPPQSRSPVSQTPDPAAPSPAAEAPQSVAELRKGSCGWFHLSLQAPAHLSVVVLKVAQLATLLQFGLVPHPELIESPFCLVQLGQQSEKRSRERSVNSKRWREWREMNRARSIAGMMTDRFGYFLCVFASVRYVELMPVDTGISALSVA